MLIDDKNQWKRKTGHDTVKKLLKKRGVDVLEAKLRSRLYFNLPLYLSDKGNHTLDDETYYISKRGSVV